MSRTSTGLGWSYTRTPEYELKAEDVTIYVSVHLPVKVSKNEKGVWCVTRSRFISIEALYAYRKRFTSRLVFVGSCSVVGATDSDKVEIEKLLWENDCVPVFQDSLSCFEQYLDFCQEILWPVMNNQLPLQEDTEILMWNDDLWMAYKYSNELFSDKVIRLISELNREQSSPAYKHIWVNDFHLFLLPAFLRKKLSNGVHRTSAQNLSCLLTGPNMLRPMEDLKVTIGMYIHTPFPTSEIFLTLPVRSEIMRGMLSVDLVGFQFYDYARHFFSSAQKLFGVRTTCHVGGALALEVTDERTVAVIISHNCAEPDYVIEQVSSRAVQEKAVLLRDQFGDRVILGSVDKLGRTSGILLKLKAFRLFLAQYSQYHQKVVLVLYIILRGTQKTTPEHATIAHEARRMQAVINSEFGFHVLIKDSLEDGDKFGLLSVSDVLLETSLKDGLNLVPFEYIIARDAWLKMEAAMGQLGGGRSSMAGSRRRSAAEYPSYFFSEPPPLSTLPRDEETSSSDRGSKGTMVSEEAAIAQFGSGVVSSPLSFLEVCKRSGRLVISEFTGCCQVLQGSARVNPWHIDTVLAALDEAITTPLHTSLAAFQRKLGYVTSRSQLRWAHDFVTQVATAATNSQSTVFSAGNGSLSSNGGSFDEDSFPLRNETPRSLISGGAGGFFPFSASVPKLNKSSVIAAFRTAKNHRVLFLDNEGTLAPDVSRLYRHYGSITLSNPDRSVDLQSKGVGPNSEVLRILALLCSDPRNIVMILSGRSKEPLIRWFQGAGRSIRFAAEHGYSWMHPLITGEGIWRSLLDDAGEDMAATTSWIQTAESIMHVFVNRTPNTYIEDKGSARVWQFRDAEPEFGIAQAKELHSALEMALRDERVDITTGKGYVEVKTRGVNKGAAVQRVLSAMREEKHSPPDFILCIGDDRSDESMFEELESNPPENCAVFTSTVGRKKTSAKFFLPDVDHVSTLLAALAEDSLLDEGSGLI